MGIHSCRSRMSVGRRVRIDMTGQALRSPRLRRLCAHRQRDAGCNGYSPAIAVRRPSRNDGSVQRGSKAGCGCLDRQITAERLTVHARRSTGRHDPTYRALQQLRMVAAIRNHRAGLTPVDAVSSSAPAGFLVQALSRRPGSVSLQNDAAAR